MIDIQVKYIISCLGAVSQPSAIDGLGMLPTLMLLDREWADFSLLLPNPKNYRSSSRSIADILCSIELKFS